MSAKEELFDRASRMYTPCRCCVGPAANWGTGKRRGIWRRRKLYGPCPGVQGGAFLAFKTAIPCGLAVRERIPKKNPPYDRSHTGDQLIDKRHSIGGGPPSSGVASRAHETLDIIGPAHILLLRGAVLIVAGDKLLVPDIDARKLGGAFRIHVEEHHIAGLQVGLFHSGSGLVQIAGEPGNGHAAFLEAIINKAGIVEFIRADAPILKGLPIKLWALAATAAPLSPAGGSVGSGSVAGGSVAGGSVAGGSVAGGSVAGGSVAGGSVAGGSVTWGVVFCGVELSGVEESAGLPLQPARASISSEATRQRAIKTLFFVESILSFQL